MTDENTARKQEDLVDYLNMSVDPFDFQYLMADWNSKRADELDNQVDLLSEVELASFTKWLRAPEQQRLIMREGGPDAPSYLFFRSAKKSPKSSWFIHYTRESPFTSFQHGAYGHELGLTVHFVNRKRYTAECPYNATNEESVYGTLFGFAFKLTDSNEWRFKAKKYGKNAVIFQCDYAVEAYHAGDGEEQSIFPLCAEYNAIPVYNVDAQTAGGTVVDREGDEQQYDSWQDIVAAFAPKKSKSKKLGALLAATGRWAPGVHVKRGTFLNIARE